MIRCKRACNELNIVRYKAYTHNFRNTFVVNMLKNTKYVYLVLKFLGYCNIGTTEDYLKGFVKMDIIEMTRGDHVSENL